MSVMLKRLAGAIAAMAALALTTGAVQAQSTWDAIQERGTLRIGVTQAPPWFTKDIRTGEWTGGLGITLGKKMAEALEVELETVEVTWGTSIAALQSNKIDLMYFLSPTAARAKVIDFTQNPLGYISQAVLAADDLDTSTWAGLNNGDVSMSVPQATSMDQFLTRMAPDADIQRFPDNAASIAAFQSGRVDAVSLMLPPLLSARQKLGAGIISVPTPAFTAPVNIGVRREDDKTWRDWLDTASLYWYETGRIQGWYDEFLVEFGVDPAASPPIQRELIFMR
ncbi:MAG: transporter substrate-binding domain-containing protein [Rhodobacteraceae bacterium]|nr:transporter substrate-binding domain-containing protein [Paracoccaceae bacterium]